MIRHRSEGLLLFVCSLLTTFSSAGQKEFSIGAKGGISIPNLKASGDNPVSKGWSSRQGPYAGLIADVSISDNFYLHAELNFSSQGGKKNGLQSIPVPPEYVGSFPPGVPVPVYVYANYNSEVRLEYVELPVLLKCDHYISDKFFVFINAGLYVGYLVGAKNLTSGSSNIYLDNKLTIPLLPQPVLFDAETDIKDDLVNFNFGVQAGIGLGYRFVNGNSLLLTGGGNYGFMHIQKDPANGENNIGAATITLGYLLNL